jgi:hypothetical protein
MEEKLKAAAWKIGFYVYYRKNVFINVKDSDGWGGGWGAACPISVINLHTKEEADWWRFIPGLNEQACLMIAHIHQQLRLITNNNESTLLKVVGLVSRRR